MWGQVGTGHVCVWLVAAQVHGGQRCGMHSHRHSCQGGPHLLACFRHCTPLSLATHPAVVTHIHNTKMAELAAPGRHSAAAQEAPAQQAGLLRRSASDSQLDALRWVHVRSGSSRGDLEPAGSAGLGGEQGRQGTAAEGSAAASSSGHQQQEGQAEGSKEGQQAWWQRFSSSLGAAPRQEPAMAPVAGGAAPLRRVQSAPELALGQEGAAQYAVRVRMWQRQPQQQRGSGSSSKGKGKGQSGESGSAVDAASSSSSSTAAAGGSHEVLPYRLQAVAHSLGAASVMLYAVVCRMRGQPHRLRRLVLLSPAGFHTPIPAVRGRGGAVLQPLAGA